LIRRPVSAIQFEQQELQQPRFLVNTSNIEIAGARTTSEVIREACNPHNGSLSPGSVVVAVLLAFIFGLATGCALTVWRNRQINRQYIKAALGSSNRILDDSFGATLEDFRKGRININLDANDENDNDPQGKSDTANQLSSLFGKTSI
jgi:hypothetical protein